MSGKKTEVKRIIISLEEFTELSEGNSIDLYCVNCKSNTEHRPIIQIGKGKTIDMGTTLEGQSIEIEDVEDAYVVDCIKCGRTSIAKFTGRDFSPWQPDKD